MTNKQYRDVEEFVCLGPEGEELHTPIKKFFCTDKGVQFNTGNVCHSYEDVLRSLNDIVDIIQDQADVRSGDVKGGN